MSEMKNSEIEWIGEIPAQWSLEKVKFHFTNKKEIAGVRSDNYDRLALTMKGVIKRPKDDADGLQPADFNTYQILEENDLVFKLIDLQNVSTSRVGLSPYIGLVSPAYIRLVKTGKVFPKYAEYFFLMMWRNQIFNHLGDSGVRSSLNASDLLNLPICVPPLDTQNLIANFLDSKCSEIDALAADIQSQIETLEQYKRSVITEAVTKGLDPNAEMKDSGIEWIGDIPSHWIVHPVGCFFGERKNINKLCTEDNLLSLSYGRVIKKDINTNGGLLPESFNTYNIVEADDIIIRPTDLQNDKRSLRTGLVHEHGIITSAYICLRPSKKLDSRYYHFLLHAYDIMKVFYNMGNGVRQGLNYSEFARLLVFEPTYDEQVAIANFLDAKCAEIDASIATKKEQLETLDSYKKSLIYEYVTGKKEVPQNVG